MASKNTLHFDPIKVPDIDDILHFAPTIVELDGGVDTPAFLDRRTMTQMIRSRYGMGYIARKNAKMAGFVLGQELPASKTGQIDVIAVGPEYQRQGLGKALIELFIGDCLERKCNRVSALYSTVYRQGASALYEDAGIPTDHELFYLSSGSLGTISRSRPTTVPTLPTALVPAALHS